MRNYFSCIAAFVLLLHESLFCGFCSGYLAKICFIFKDRQSGSADNSENITVSPELSKYFAPFFEYCWHLKLNSRSKLNVSTSNKRRMCILIYQLLCRKAWKYQTRNKKNILVGLIIALQSPQLTFHHANTERRGLQTPATARFRLKPILLTNAYGLVLLPFHIYKFLRLACRPLNKWSCGEATCKLLQGCFYQQCFPHSYPFLTL